MISIMGGKLRLNEHSMRPRQAMPGDRLRGTVWTVSGQEATYLRSIGIIRTMERNILGLNDLVSPVPIVSEQSPHMNGWYRIISARAVAREHAGRTMILDWELQLLGVDAELELRLSGQALGNELGLSERIIVGLPQSATGVFFPKGPVGATPFTELTTGDNKVIRRWEITAAAANDGVRFNLGAADGSDGQCNLLLDGQHVVGLRPGIEAPTSWELNNGIIQIRNTDAARLGRIVITSLTPINHSIILEPKMNVVPGSVNASSLNERLEYVNISQNEQHSCTIFLVYSTLHAGLRRDLMVNIRRGSPIVSFAVRGPNFVLDPLGSAATTGYAIIDGARGFLATNKLNPHSDGTVSFAGSLYLGREGTAGFCALNVTETTVHTLAERNRQTQEWLGQRGAFLNWVLK